MNFDRATNPHLHPTDFAHEIHMRILAGSITSLQAWVGRWIGGASGLVMQPVGWWGQRSFYTQPKRQQ